MMKNIIIRTIIRTMCVMTVVFVVLIMVINKCHEDGLNETINTYEELIDTLEEDCTNIKYKYSEISDKYNDLNSRMEYLEEQIYFMMDGEEYIFTIQHDSETHRYEGTRKGLFISKSHIVFD